MLSIGSSTLKSIFPFVLVGEFLSSHPYKYFNEKAMELLNRMKAQVTKSLRCRKALSKIIRRHEKAFANFGQIMMKLFLNFIFKLES